jgi:uncharacterized membrane protein YidH (DUF202 family)
MSEDQSPSRQRVPLPTGYRQGIITAITVLLGFSLLFFRYWDFELPGTWTISSIIAAFLMAVSILLQFLSLWRSLQVKDDDEKEYGITLRWFLASILTLLSSLAIAGLTMSGLTDRK